MSSSSTTACSRSPSPATPVTPDSDHLNNVVTQEDLAAWCHSLSPAGFLIGEESNFADSLKKSNSRPLKLEDILQDDAIADSPALAGSDTSSKFMLSRSPSVSLPMGIEVADLLAGARNSITSTRLVPPPLSHIRREATGGSQCVVYPPKESCYNLPIMIPSIPEGGTKSRVETQVRLTVDLAHASASSGEPLKYDRVGSWKWLRLPKGTSTKRRARKEAKIDAPPEDTLHLTTEVTCASPPHTRVSCCSSCQGREAKRVARKLAARVRPARSDSESPDDVRFIPGRGKHEDTTNLVQFNCPEVLDFSSGSVVLPLRITCYCRHHREKVGFNVHFTMLDHNGRIVGSGTTRPIMITDDHKSTGVNAKNNQTNAADISPNPDWPYGAVGDLPDSNATGAKRKNSRADATDRTKKRTKPYDSTTRSGRAVRRRGSNVSLGSAQSPLTSAVGTRAPTRSPTPAQILQNGSMMQAVEQSASPESIDPAEVAATILAALENPVSPGEDVTSNSFDDILMPDANSQLDLDLDSHPFSLDELTHSSFFNTDPTSSITMASDPTQALSPSSEAQAVVSYMLFNSEPPAPITSLPPPKIHRLIPAMGPTYGGIEVTVLGANFHPAMQLNCVFGESVSSSTQRWSDNTLVCLLPPSTTPGVVGVWFDGVEKEDDGTPPVLFTYTDETDRALMELALQVVGLKMTGKIEDARNVAMRIVTTTGPEDTPGSIEANNAMQLSSGPSTSSMIDARRLLLSRADETQDFENLILDSLAIMDVPMSTPSPSVEAIISHATANGQTLLHFAARLNFTHVTQFLLDHDIDTDTRDRNGYTALHHAAMMGSTECARLLIEAGAALDIVNAHGKTPAEVAKPGFIGSFHSMCNRRQRGWSFREQREEEAAWADVEEDESEADDVPVRPAPRRRALERKNSPLRERPVQRRASTDFLKEKKEDVSPDDPVSNPKAAEAGMVDEKQVMTIMDMFQRTLAQIQHPNLPQLPHLRGMPAWGALPQMPAVFPVYVPMSALPSLSALWGDKQRSDQQGVDGAEKSWRAMWEKWMTLAARSNVDEAVDAPPAYTPREDGEMLDGDVKVALEKKSASMLEEVEEVHQPAAPSPSSSAPEKTSSRRVGYPEEIPIPEQEVKSYGYRPSKKQSRRSQKKDGDRMLVLFWVPVLLIGLIWAILHTMHVGFGAMKAIVTIHAGLQA